MKLQLQSILLPSADTCDVEELYFHKTDDEVCFDGYFNLFYIEKRKAYTVIDNLSLQLILKGYDRLTLMHDEEPVGSIDLEPEEKIEYLIELPYENYDTGVFWFKLKAATDQVTEEISAETISGFFVSDIEEDKLRKVNIGIDICTYKREEYVIRNLNQLKDKLLFNQGLDAASHYNIYVVDNGKTLQDYEEIEELKADCGSGLKIIPNKNSGGAGGFTRGMLEVLNDKEKLGLTHVLVMDDDATYEPDSFIRIYGLLVTLNERWKDITVGGAMFRDDFPYILFAAGEYWKHGYIYSPSMHTDLRQYSNASMPLLTETGHEYEWYSGWWLCCYSLNTVRNDNLPIPFFLHHDDMEFGIRNQKAGIVFLNGVGVWHGRPDQVYPGSNVYYDVRNNLIEIALNETDNRQVRTAGWLMFRAITASAIRLRYQDVKLQYQGFLDFLKGPKWLYWQDPEKLNAKVRSEAIEMKPWDEVVATLSESDQLAAKRQLEEYNAENGPESVLTLTSHVKSGNPVYWLTYNGWILPSNEKEIKLVASTESPYKGFRRQRILMYEPGSGKATVGVRDKDEMRNILEIYRKTLALFLRYFKKACRNWKKNIGKITNKSAWEKYLKE